MPRTNPCVRLAIISIAACLSGCLLSAQEPAAAPVPAQIINARKAFISNGGEQRNRNGGLYYTGGPDRAYNQFYAAMKAWSRYELVSAPGDADLVVQIHVADLRSEASDDEMSVVILDPKTNVVLWTISEPAAAAGWQKTRDASFDRALSLLVDDLKNLVAGPAAAGIVKK